MEKRKLNVKKLLVTVALLTALGAAAFCIYGYVQNHKKVDGLPVLTEQADIENPWVDIGWIVNGDGLLLQVKRDNAYEKSEEYSPWSPDLKLEKLPVYGELSFFQYFQQQKNIKEVFSNWGPLVAPDCPKNAFGIDTYRDGRLGFYRRVYELNDNYRAEIWDDLTFEFNFKRPEVNYYYRSEEDLNSVFRSISDFGEMIDLDNLSDKTTGESVVLGTDGRFFEKSDDPVQNIINYYFNDIAVTWLGHRNSKMRTDCSEIKYITNMRVSHEPMTKLGDYPIISAEEAEALIPDEGTVKFAYSSGMFKRGKLVNVDLIYSDIYDVERHIHPSSYIYSMPYYRFVYENEQGADLSEDNRYNYFTVDVPAVEMKYLKPFE